MVKSGHPRDSVGSQKPQALIPLHKLKFLAGFHQQLSYCMSSDGPSSRGLGLRWKSPVLVEKSNGWMSLFSSFFDVDSNKTGLSIFSNFGWLFPQFPQATQLVVSNSTKNVGCKMLVVSDVSENVFACLNLSELEMVGCFPDVFLLVFFLTHGSISTTAEGLLIYHRVLAFFFTITILRKIMSMTGKVICIKGSSASWKSVWCLLHPIGSNIFTDASRQLFGSIDVKCYPFLRDRIATETDNENKHICGTYPVIYIYIHIIKDSIARNLAQQRVYHSWHFVATVNSKKSCLYLLEGSSNHWMDRKIEGSQPPNHSFPQVWDTHLSPRLGTKSNGVRGFVRYKPILGRRVLGFWGCYGCYTPFKEGSSTWPIHNNHNNHNKHMGCSTSSINSLMVVAQHDSHPICIQGQVGETKKSHGFHRQAICDEGPTLGVGNPRLPYGSRLGW